MKFPIGTLSKRLGGLAAVALICATGFGWVLGAAAQSSPPTEITVASAPVELSRGCNVFVVLAPLGTTWQEILTRFSDPGSVLSIWQYDNPSQRYRGVYFSEPLAPVDEPQSTVAYQVSVWACVDADGTVS